MKPATLIRMGALAVISLALEVACRTGLIGRFTLIPPSEMVAGVFRILWAGKINDEIGTTLAGVLAAAAGAVLAGFVLGTVLHAWPRIRRCLDPLLATYYAVPIYVFYPMLLVFFGMNRMPIIVIGFLFAVVAMITSTLNGLDRVPPVLLKTARVLGMSHTSTTLRIVLPSAAPYIFGGVKLAIAYAFVGVLGAEFILSNSGLGYQIALAFNNFDNVAMYSLILFVVVVVAGVNTALFSWERSLLRRRETR
jgi:NitT/TauT family transport system permease protein